MGRKPNVKKAGPAFYAQIDFKTWTPFQRAVRMVLRVFWRMMARVDVEGVENVPLSGGLVLAVNHVYIMDTPLFLGLYPRRMVVLVLERWRRWPVISWFVNIVGNAIYVSRGGVNKEALACALRALKVGGCVGITPEGTVSKTRSLIRGNNGVAFLASRAQVPILPAVAWGQEKAIQHWMRLRRVPIHMRYGQVIHLSDDKADTAQLEACTTQVMTRLSGLLPKTYQGSYSEDYPG